MGTFGKVISVHLRYSDLNKIDAVARHINHLHPSRSAAARQLIQHGYAPFLEAALHSPSTFEGINEKQNTG